MLSKRRCHAILVSAALYGLLSHFGRKLYAIANKLQMLELN
jgi:hypothetical protein